MDRNLDDIEELFKTALEDEKEMPEPEVWEAIDHILDKDTVITMKKKYNDLKKVAFLLFFLLLGLSIYEFEKPSAIRNNNVLNKGIVSEKSNVANLKDGSNVHANKLASPGSSTNNKSKSLPGNSSVLKDSSTNIKQTELSSALVADEKQARDYKKIFCNSKLLRPRQIAANNPVVIVENEIVKVQEERFVEGDIKSNEITLLRDYNTLYAKRSNLINLDSVNSISLSHSPAQIKVTQSINNKNSLVQSTKTKSNHPSPFFLNLFFSPDFASYRLQDNVPGNNINDATETEKNERHEFSSTISALVEYRAKKHWSIQSGLTYSNTNITVAPKTIYAQSDNSGSIKYLLNTSSGYGYILPSFSSNPNVGDSLFAFTSTHTLQYLSIPVAIKYNITKGKFNFYAMAGVAVNYLTKGKVETSVEDGSNNEPEVVNNLQGLKKVYLSGLTSMGIDYNFYKKIAITFAPAYRFAINSINKDDSVNSYPNSVGLTTGMKLNF